MSSNALSPNVQTIKVSQEKPRFLAKANRYQIYNSKSNISSIDSYIAPSLTTQRSLARNSVEKQLARQNLHYEVANTKASNLKSDKFRFESFSLQMLQENKWHSKIFSHILRKALNFKQLASISLNLSFKTGCQYEELRKSLQGSISLKSLEVSFSNCKFHSDSLQNFTKLAKQNENLFKLTLSFFKCNFSKHDFDNAIKNLKDSPSLRRLQLNIHHFKSNPSLIEISETMKSLSSLEEIGLGYKADTNLGFDGLRDAFSKVQNLKSLDLDFTENFSITVQDMPLLEAGIETLKLLRVIRLALCFAIREAWIKKIQSSSRYLEVFQVNQRDLLVPINY